MSIRKLLALTLATALLASGCAKKEEPKAEAPAEPEAPAIDLWLKNRRCAIAPGSG